MVVPPLRCRPHTGQGATWWSVSALWGPQHVSSPSLDRIPQILDVASELEFNLETMPRINCAAAGNPFPVRGSMELRKPDGTVLLVSPPALTPGPPSHQPHHWSLRPPTPKGFL